MTEPAEIALSPEVARLILVRVEWLKISQREMGRRLGLPASSIHRYEAGKHEPPGTVMKLLGLIEDIRGVSAWLEGNKDG